MNEFTKYVGLDTHKETIAVAIADAGRTKPRYYGEIANTPEAIRKLVKTINPSGEVVSFCYEAGPCGYGIHRQLTGMGHDCAVLAPSLTPLKPGDRVKTDRRDSESLARLHRAGELTAVWVPGNEQEAIRDLTRAREDMKITERQVKLRLGSFLLRHGKTYDGTKSNWTQAHFRWMEHVKFNHPVQQIVFEEYVDTVKQAQSRVKSMERELNRVIDTWVLAPVVKGLMALRGVNLVTAMTVIAELGDISRFQSPRQLMAYLGLVPSERVSQTLCNCL